MSEDSIQKKFYVTFERGANGAFKTCEISQKLPVAGEESDEPSSSQSLEKESLPAQTDFKSVVTAFQSNMDGYRNFVPLTMWMGSHLAYQGGFQGLHSLATKKGTAMETRSDDTSSTFAVDIEHYREFAILSERMDIAVNGAKQLPAIMLIGLISAYDAMLGRLLSVVFNRRENIIFTSEKALKFSDLLAYGSIEAAKAALIDKEIETILRESHHEQFAIMEKKFTVPLRKDLSVWPKFIEICERRNLITHTGSIVSAQYLASGRENKFDISHIQIGERLKVDSIYYADAVDAVYEVGIKLCHVFWRKFWPDQRKSADNALNRLGYSLIRDRSYPLAEAILRFAAGLKKHYNDEIRRMMVVNLANAVRLQNRQDEANKILSDEDWSAVGDNFAISVAAVRGDVEKVMQLMIKMGPSGPLKVQDYRTWPVFRGMYTNEKFSKAFKEVFNSDLITAKKAQVEEPDSGDATKNIDTIAIASSEI